MWHKFRRMLCYVKELLLKLFFTPLAFFARRFFGDYKKLWLVCERGNDARDNGYWFFKYLSECHPEVNARFIITDDSVDKQKVSVLGKTVSFKSFSHYLCYYAADYLIGTHVQPCAPDLILHYHLAKYKIKPRGKQVFLQHGVIYNEMKWLWRDSLYIDLFVCGAKPEYDYIKSTYGHPEGVVRYLGLCRFDNLIKSNSRQKMILLMPTWRGSKYPSGKDFLKTPYYLHFQSLINNPVLDELLSQNGYKLVFYPHIEIQKDMHFFSTASKHILLADKQSFQIQELITSCSLLITDYSSVFFDVAFLNRPQIFYQFDSDDFRKYHYQKGYLDFKHDGLGEVCETETQVVEALKKYIDGNMQLEPVYKKRIDNFFILHDDKNCDRIYNSICSL